MNPVESDPEIHRVENDSKFRSSIYYTSLLGIALLCTFGIGFYLLRNEYLTQSNTLKDQIQVLEKRLFDMETESAILHDYIINNLNDIKKQQYQFKNYTIMMHIEDEKILNDLNLSLLEQNVTMDQMKEHLKVVKKDLLDQQFILNKLTNKTSNAEVLDKLISTEHKINEQLQSTQFNIMNTLESTTNQVAEELITNKLLIENQMNRTRLNVAQQLMDTTLHVNYELQKSQEDMYYHQLLMKKELNNSINSMNQAVHNTNITLYQLRYNVILQSQQLNQQLDQTKLEVHDIVEVAKSTIQGEVQVVKDNIEKYVAITNEQFAAENDFVKYQLAGEFMDHIVTSDPTPCMTIFLSIGTFTLLGCLISLWHLTSHGRHYDKPDVQRRIMAVLWMVPIYAVTSWCSLVLPKFENYFGTFRDCYEAYAVYTFFGLLIAILEDGQGLPYLISLLSTQIREDHEAAEEAHRIYDQEMEEYRNQLEVYQRDNPENRSILSYLWCCCCCFCWGNCCGTSSQTRVPAPPIRPKKHVDHMFPPCFLSCFYHPSSYHSQAKQWLFQCQAMAIQFVLLKPILAVVPFTFQLCGFDFHDRPLYSDNEIHWDSPRLYILIIQNFSVTIAFYGLLSFYHGIEKDLAWCDPWPKFLCIKGIVFATFWQGLMIQLMSNMGLVDEKTSIQIQNLIICIEMLIASIAHWYIFPHNEWQAGYKRERERSLMLRDSLAIRDFVRDIRMMTTRWDTHGPTRQGSLNQSIPSSPFGEGKEEQSPLVSHLNPVRSGGRSPASYNPRPILGGANNSQLSLYHPCETIVEVPSTDSTSYSSDVNDQSIMTFTSSVRLSPVIRNDDNGFEDEKNGDETTPLLRSTVPLTSYSSMNRENSSQGMYLDDVNRESIEMAMNCLREITEMPGFLDLTSSDDLESKDATMDNEH